MIVKFSWGWVGWYFMRVNTMFSSRLVEVKPSLPYEFSQDYFKMSCEYHSQWSFMVCGYRLAGDQSSEAAPEISPHASQVLCNLVNSADKESKSSIAEVAMSAVPSLSHQVPVLLNFFLPLFVRKEFLSRINRVYYCRSFWTTLFTINVMNSSGKYIQKIH